MKDKKAEKKKELFEKFLVCPNCRAAIFRKKALKIQKPGTSRKYCGKCGAEIGDILKKGRKKN